MTPILTLILTLTLNLTLTTLTLSLTLALTLALTLTLKAMLEAKLRRLERQERERHATASSMPGVNQRTPFALLTGDVSLLVVEPPTPSRPRDTTTGGNKRTPLCDTASALHRWLDETVLDEAVRDHRNALAAGPKTSRPPTPPTPVLGRVRVQG